MLLIAESQELYCNFDVYFQADDLIYIKWGGWSCIVAPFLFPVISPSSEHKI